MSSVNSSDSSLSSSPSNRDDVRKTREEDKKNEAEMVKRHAKEIRRLNETHAQEVENLKASHDKQVEEIQKNARESISERDNKYQSEIDGIRAMHRKTLQGTMEDSQKRDELYRDTINREGDSRATQSDERLNTLKEQFSRENRDRDQELTQHLNQYRDDFQTGMKSQKDALDKAHVKETDSIRNERDQKVAHLQGQFDSYHKNSESRLKDQQVKHVQDMQRSSDNSMHELAKERTDRSESEEKWLNANSGSLADIREHYNENNAKNRQSYDDAVDRIKDNYNKHVEPEMQSVRNQYQNLKDKSDRDQRALEFKTAREKAQFRDSYSKNIDNYKMQRDEAVRTGNERRTMDIDNLNTRNDKDMVETHRFYNQKMDDQNRRLRSEYQNINGDFKARNDQVTSMADLRVRNILDTTEEEKQRLTRQQGEAHDVMRRDQADTLRTIRADTDAEKAEAIDRVKEQAKQKEVDHSERVAQMQQTHQRDILNLQDQLMRERKSGDDSLRRTIDDMSKAHKTDLDQQMTKYEEKIRNLQNAQSEELRRVNRAQEEKLSQLAAVQRKA
jgi:hypothetical protein